MATTKRPGKKMTKAKTFTADAKTSIASGANNAGKGAGQTKLTIDRRDAAERRAGADRRKKDEPVALERRALQRRTKVNRRRQIDPTTCERDYTGEEIEFMNALDNYKRASGRMFPTCSELLEVIRKLGYEKRPQPALTETPKTEFACEQIGNKTAV